MPRDPVIYYQDADGDFLEPLRCEACGGLFPEDEVYISNAFIFFCSQQCAEDYQGGKRAPALEPD
jgi:hypothetical protein